MFLHHHIQYTVHVSRHTHTHMPVSPYVRRLKFRLNSNPWNKHKSCKNKNISTVSLPFVFLPQPCHARRDGACALCSSILCFVSDPFLSNQPSLDMICFIKELLRIGDSTGAFIAHTVPRRSCVSSTKLGRPEEKCAVMGCLTGGAPFCDPLSSNLT